MFRILFFGWEMRSFEEMSLELILAVHSASRLLLDLFVLGEVSFGRLLPILLGIGWARGSGGAS